MDTRFLQPLDEYFSANYSDYVRLSALEGYVMPEIVYVAPDGNIARRDPECMRLCHQKDSEALLKALKAELTDTNFTFNFAFIPVAERIRDRFRKYTFAKILPSVLAKYNETVESAGAKLAIEPRFWRKIAKGKLYPEKCTVLALALVCNLQHRDLTSLLNVCGMTMEKDNVRDVVVTYLVEQRITNLEMRERCLAEYRVTNLPIRGGDVASEGELA